MPTFFVRNEKEFMPDGLLKHFDWRSGCTRKPWIRGQWVRKAKPHGVADKWCLVPDATVDRVMHAILDRYPGSKDVEDVLIAFEQELDAQPLS